jgi:threonine dehydratase
MIPTEWLELATRRLQGQIHQTPLTYDADLDLYLKWENRQVTGSFKIRGALNKVLSLEGWEQKRGLVTASAGNHGQGVAFAGRLVGAPVTVFASEHAVPAKIEAMRALGAEVRLVEGGYEVAERTGEIFAGTAQATWISPYNDGQVVAGQATLGLEILAQLEPKRPGTVVVPVGGGGLLAGIGSAMADLTPRPRLVGAQSVASPFFYAIYHHGSQYGVVEMDSLADGLAGAVETGSITIPLVRRYGDDFVLVTEEQIAAAIAYAWQKYGEIIEGSAAVTLAAVLGGMVGKQRSDEDPLVVVISGGNIQPEIHAHLCTKPGAGSF